MSFAVVSRLYPHPINGIRGEHHDRDLHVRRLAASTASVVPAATGRGSWGKQGPELLDHRLALYGEEQRMVFGANTYRQFAQMLDSSTEESDVGDPWVSRMRSLPATVVSATVKGPLDWPDTTVVR